MADQTLRVRLDLTEINGVPYKYVWAPVFTRELRTIEDFKATLYQKFNFGKNRKVKLFVQDSLLLDEETVTLLRENDTVKVVYDEEFSTSAYSVDLNASYDNGVQSTGFKRPIEDCSADLLLPNPKKRHKKTKSLTSVENCPKLLQASAAKSHDFEDKTYCIIEGETSKNVHKEKKHRKKKVVGDNVIASSTENASPLATFTVSVPHEINIESSDVINCESKEQKEIKKSKKNKLSAFRETFTIENNAQIEDIAHTDSLVLLRNKQETEKHEISASKSPCKADTKVEPKVEIAHGNNCPKKKRRRHRKRKLVPFDIPSPVNLDTVKVEPSPRAFPVTPCSTRKHIVFTEHTETEPMEKDDKVYVNLHSYLDNFKSAETEKLQLNANRNNIANDTSSEMQEVLDKTQVTEQSFWHNSTPIEFSEVMSATVTGNATVNGCENNDSKTVDYTNMARLNTLPKVGTHLAFKVLELSDMYCPEVSPYKEGIVKTIDPCTEEMEIELIKEEVVAGKTGKFENIYEDEVPTPETIKSVKLSWAALIEPKFVPN